MVFDIIQTSAITLHYSLLNTSIGTAVSPDLGVQCSEQHLQSVKMIMESKDEIKDEPGGTVTHTCTE